ncbi:DUF995 domain-containing protein [Brucella tritici]|uniref:DUF995 domain-containing protein n=2 Tax=Brucella tritici TaxID=94626 RepID=A0A6L3YMH6_9HYPH|nr:DUF995 domain-containing protein [Brucella tritici]KAB2684213.1 DUF995 domain-containing protein [Brucella tritici]
MKHSMFEGQRSRYGWRTDRSRDVLTLFVLLAGLGTPAGAATATADGLPEGARVMTPAELYVLYRDKNWQWADGAGRMESQNRRFTARVDGDKGKAWAEGRWRITWSGQMCFDAKWHLDQGVFPNKTCFSHRIADGTIYQKREPDGVWYIFRHAGGNKDDEARKLVSIETITPKTEALNLALPVAQSPTQ